MSRNLLTEDATNTPLPASSHPTPDRPVIAAFATIILLGGANAVAVRFSNAELPPFWGATLRFGLAAALFFIVVLAKRLPLPRGRALRGVLLYGLFGFGLGYAFMYWGLVEVPAGVTQVIVALVPLLTFFFAVAHGLERFRWRGLIGALIAVAGVGLGFIEQLNADIPLPSLLAVVLGSACFAEAGVIAKKFPSTNPITTNALAMAAGTALLMGISLVAGEAHPLPSLASTWTALAYLVLAGTVVVFMLFLYVLSRWTASAASYQFVLLPFVTIALASVLAGEPVTLPLLLGGVLVLIGVWVGVFSKPRTRPAEPEPAQSLP